MELKHDVRVQKDNVPNTMAQFKENGLKLCGKISSATVFPNRILCVIIIAMNTAQEQIHTTGPNLVMVPPLGSIIPWSHDEKRMVRDSVPDHKL